MSEKKQGYLDFDEYIRQGEPGQKEKASIWQAAIGLQAVDGLTTSDYLKQTARKHIEGTIDIDQARNLIRTYYQSKVQREPDDDDKQEADKVSANITKILSSKTSDFSTGGYIALHRRIFEGVTKHAGELRKHDFTKKEWALEGDTVHYLNWEDLRRALDYDIAQERDFSYNGISPDELIAHISRFVSDLWQIHAFNEGNTRTTAVFSILYLRDIGFEVDNEMFARHSWYFRNALVRANYKNAVKSIDYSPIYLERFFRNLLLGEKWDLRNRYLHIHPTDEWRIQPNLDTRTSTRTSTRISTTVNKINPDSKLYTNNENIIELVRVIGNGELSIKQMMELKGLKHRQNFLDYHLEPSLRERYVRMKYPDRPNHPRQRYLLTAKGLALFREVQ